MASENQADSQKMIVIALVVIAVLLVAIVGVLIWQQSKASTSLPTPTATSGAAGTTAPGGSTGAPAGMGGATGAAPAAFDPKTATKVPSNSTPEQMLKAYNEAVIKGKFAEAYKLLPVDKQQSYGDAAAYEAQLKQYGITSYKMGKPAESGDQITIVTEQVTPQMPITYTWTFKKVGNQWYVASRTMGGTVQ